MMAPDEDLRELERELGRVVDRLTSMPLAKVSTCIDAVLDAAQFIVAEDRRLGASIPPDAVLPRLGPHGMGAMLAVVGNDYLQTAKATPGADVRPVLDRLSALRRGLP